MIQARARTSWNFYRDRVFKKFGALATLLEANRSFARESLENWPRPKTRKRDFAFDVLSENTIGRHLGNLTTIQTRTIFRSFVARDQRGSERIDPNVPVICVHTRGDGQELGQVRAIQACISRSEDKCSLRKGWRDSVRHKKVSPDPLQACSGEYVNLVPSAVSIFVSLCRVSQRSAPLEDNWERRVEYENTLEFLCRKDRRSVQNLEILEKTEVSPKAPLTADEGWEQSVGDGKSVIKQQ
ncbi:hypothetical protein K0M31_009384 [Melipona bicolor]|uniref:Uncharacterized protein n=1 Tax=Melipona bicolor TaxID=60889 RepID=A0AA40FN42_9HYME|nr:hypothetical protein K0M31_009384 [Melipona bicolor]